MAASSDAGAGGDEPLPDELVGVFNPDADRWEPDDEQRDAIAWRADTRNETHWIIGGCRAEDSDQCWVSAPAAVEIERMV